MQARPAPMVGGSLPYMQPSPVISARRSVSMGPVRIMQSPQSQVPAPVALSPQLQPAQAQPVLQHPAPQPAPPPLSPEEYAPWREAARAFVMNSDFDVGPILAEKKRTIFEVMEVMKAQSGGKGTIQALGDKIILSKLLENLGVPQMPLMLSTYTKVNKAEVEKLVAKMEKSGDPDSYDIVIKPTHLSSAVGALVMSKTRWDKEGYNSSKLIKHMEQYLAKKAADCESEALKSLVPGFIVQPRYRSVVGFGFPLEMRIVTIWGKARMGVWWWGRHGDPKGRRTTWLVRRPRIPGKLSSDDEWEALHEHAGGNRGFEVALALFREAMPAMSQAAEAIATAVGAPFLRVDFFVGSSKWGVRMNEVAYGSGVDYKRRSSASTCQPNGSFTGALIDDGPAIAEMIQEGFTLCQRKPPAHFLRMLGAKNAVYEAPASLQHLSATKPLEPHMRVEAVPPEKRVRTLPEDAVQDMIGIYEGPGNELPLQPVTAASCETQAAPDPPAGWPLHSVRNVGGYPQRFVIDGTVSNIPVAAGPTAYRTTYTPVTPSVVPQAPVARRLPTSLSFVAVPTPGAQPTMAVQPTLAHPTMLSPVRPASPVFSPSPMTTVGTVAAALSPKRANQVVPPVSSAQASQWQPTRMPPTTVRYGNLQNSPTFVTPPPLRA
eukprot:CAMPEP_0197658400 /NCGR_PEP_ID=MMETSP1338-20131121/45216_1 /TAXON_ID=43686 ORGANISM="Pelagodinium beii, Strain RCC1491" /NCGR_SAMPLE_ID=MMETSP1338 /ASSEMBLY_ACC=CAM_ASM_000754 /LENGTH=658 /DNA_ID=CAMNT_0043234985 /DNA_START=118 /DNA_END=2094 /DNA_ORIENTATION=-